MHVTYGAELEADLGSAWTHHFPSGRHHVWVATQIDPLWVGRGRVADLITPGKGAILAPGAPRWIGTHTDGDPPPRVDTGPIGGIAVTTLGTHHGAVTFGPLMPEALGLPDFFTTAEHQDPYWSVDDDVALALQHLGSLVGQRWPGPPQDALARVIVTSMLAAWRPTALADNSLTRCLAAIAEPGPPPAVPELAALARTSQSTLLRRFRTATGLTPDEFSRWFRTLPVRSALLRGEDPDLVAARHGFRSVRSMQRVVGRVESTTERLILAGSAFHIER